jgi:hypothetical protein
MIRVSTLYDSETACTNYLLRRGLIEGDNGSKAPVEMCRVIRFNTQKHRQFTNEVIIVIHSGNRCYYLKSTI